MATRRLEIAQRPVTDALIPLYDVDLSLYGGGTYHWTVGPLNSQTANLIPNPCLLKNTTGWTLSGGTAAATDSGQASAVGPTWSLKGFGSGYMRRSTGLTTGQYFEGSIAAVTSNFAISPPLRQGAWLEASARVSPNRCRGTVYIEFRDASNALISTSNLTDPNAFFERSGSAAKADAVDDHRLLWVQAQVPAAAKYARVVIRGTSLAGGSSDPYVFFSMVQLCQVYGASAVPLPFLPSSVVGEVAFGGVIYKPVPLELTGVQTTGQGAIPRPKVTVPNIGNFVRAIMGTYRDMVRAKVTRRRVFRRFLDGMPEADPTEYYGPDIWFIDRVAQAAPEAVTFELASPLDIQGKKLPGRQIIRDVCSHSYRTWTAGSGFKMGSCPYAGASYFTADGTPTLDPAQDVCGRSFTNCGQRFPYPQSLPTRAFPGSVRARV